MQGKNPTLKIIALATTLTFIGGMVYLMTYDPGLSGNSKIQNMPVLKSGNWGYINQKPLEQRVTDPPEILLEYLNSSGGIKVHAVENPTLTLEIRELLGEFPPPLIRFMEQHLIGIFIVSDINSSALTLTLEDWKGFKKGLIVINADKMLHSANSWHNLRLKANFAHSNSMHHFGAEPEQPQWKVRSVIVEPNKDNRKELLRFLILHELGHIYAVVTGVEDHYYHKLKPIKENSFASLSWKTPEQSKFDSIMPLRKKINFYNQQHGTNLHRDIPEIMQNFEQTNFPSLYACLNPSEDFAECFAIYIHTIILGNPFIFEVSNERKTIQRIEDPFGQPRMNSKRLFMRKNFQRHLGLE